MRSLFGLLWPHRTALVMAVWLAIASALASLAMAQSGAQAAHEALAGRVVLESLLTLGALGLARVLLGLWLSAVTFQIARALATDVRARIVRNALAVDLGVPPTDLLTRATQDVFVLQAVAAFRAPTALADLLTVVVLGAYALHLDPITVGAAGGIVLCASPLVLLLSRRAARASTAGRTEYAAVAESLSEGFEAAAVLRHHGAATHAAERLASNLVAHENTVLSARLWAALRSPLVQAAALLAVVVVVVVVAARISDGTLLRDDAVALVVALTLGARPLSRLAGVVDGGVGFEASLARVGELLAIAPAEDAPAAERREWSRVVVRDLRVRRGGREVLHGVSFELERGERVAIVGTNGAGKTTLLLALLGLVDHEGTIEIDGVSGTLGALAAWVPQEASLLEGTISSNVALGSPEDPRRVADALERVGASSWLAARGGVGAPIERRGKNLSRGERQRVCLARALYRDRTLLLIDEPTASLDSASVETVVSTLGDMLEGTTALVVSHDQRVLSRCDRVIEITDGRVG